MKHFIAFMCFSCLLTTKVLSKELSDITYEIMVDDKALTLMSSPNNIMNVSTIVEGLTVMARSNLLLQLPLI